MNDRPIDGEVNRLDDVDASKRRPVAEAAPRTGAAAMSRAERRAWARRNGIAPRNATVENLKRALEEAEAAPLEAENRTLGGRK